MYNMAAKPISQVMAWQVLALNLAIAASNVAGLKLHQYWSVAINFCTQIEILMSTIVCAFKKCWGKEGKNICMLLWRNAKSDMSACKKQ